MIYTYLVLEDFIKKLDEYNRNEVNIITNFISSNFIFKENIYNCGDRDLLSNYGTFKNLNIDEFLSNLSNDMGFLEGKSNLGFDFIFSEKSFGVKNTSISCDDILKNKTKEGKDLKKEIKKNTPNFFLAKRYTSQSEKKKQSEKLNEHLLRIFKTSDDLFFVDRMIPIILLENKPFQINTLNTSIKNISTLLKPLDIKIKFYSALSNKHITTYNKMLVSEKLSNFMKPFKGKDIQAFVKHDKDVYEILHERYIFSFFNGEIFNIYNLAKGIQLWDGKNSINTGKLSRLDTNYSYEIKEEFNEKVKYSKNYARFPSN